MHSLSGGIALIEIVASCILAILLHELSHTVAARIFGVALYSFRPTAIGIRAIIKGSTRSFKKQAFIFLAGPLGNFLAALILFGSRGFLHKISEANLAIACFNLLPMYPLDGGQIFVIIFYKIMGSNKTFRLIRRISLSMKVVLAFVGLLQILLYGNPSVLIAALLLPGTRLLEETVSIMKLENLLNRKQRIMRKGIYSARHLIVMEDTTLGDAIQKLDYDRFHILYVLNNEMEMIGQITEQQIIKAMQTCNSTDKICEIFFLGL